MKSEKKPKRAPKPQPIPDYVKCCALQQQDSGVMTWCGKVAGRDEWLFVDANHAIATGRTASPLMLCADCTFRMKEAIKAIAYGPKRRAPAPYQRKPASVEDGDDD